MSTYFTGGTIWCGIGITAQSLRVSDGRIAAIDCAPEPGDEVINLGNQFLAPAFMDGHAHPLFAGRQSQGPLVNGLDSVDSILAEVKRYADANPDQPWIIGGAYEAVIVERGDFLATWLDQVVSDRPVVLRAVDHHTIWVNTKALEIAGITANTPDPEGGSIARNSDGSPRGTLREPTAMDLVTRHSPPATIESDVKAIAWASDRYVENGVTAATDAWIEPGMAEAYIAADAAGVLAIDMNIFFLAQPDSWRALKDDFLKLREQIDNLGPDSHLTGRTIKIILDGALSAGTAALLSPYLDDPTSHGLYTWNDDELLDAAAYFDAEGFQLHIHAIGDGAIRQGLDVIEKVVRINPLRDRRPVIAHAQLIDADDLPRFAELDVIANYQPLWTYLDPMNKILIAPRIGDDRNNRQYQLASMLKSGARIAYGSDWPVTSQIPLEALAVPTHRQSPDRQPEGGWSPHESISVEQSLSFYTHGVAYQNYKEDRYGEIKVGAEADLMILSQNPLTCDPHDVSKISVVTVYKRGKVIKSH
jgi:predicted amidohydrolase YtcJ